MILHRRPILYNSANGLVLVPNVIPLPQLWMGSTAGLVVVEDGGNVIRYVIEGDLQAIQQLVEAGGNVVRQITEAGGNVVRHVVETGGSTVRIVIEDGGPASFEGGG